MLENGWCVLETPQVEEGIHTRSYFLSALMIKFYVKDSPLIPLKENQRDIHPTQRDDLRAYTLKPKCNHGFQPVNPSFMQTPQLGRVVGFQKHPSPCLLLAGWGIFLLSILNVVSPILRYLIFSIYNIGNFGAKIRFANFTVQQENKSSAEKHLVFHTWSQTEKGQCD